MERIGVKEKIEKKQEQVTLVNLMLQNHGQVKVVKILQNKQYLRLVEMVEEGLLKLVTEDETTALFQLNEHQMAFKKGQKVLWNKDGEFLKARVIRTSPKRIEVHIWEANGSETTRWVTPDKLTAGKRPGFPQKPK